MRPSMLNFFKHRPTGLLARYVDSFWYRGQTEAATTGMLVLPSGRAEFVFSLDGAPQACWTGLDRSGQRRDLSYATLRLPNCAPVASALSGYGAAFGVSFKPHGLRHFCRVAFTDVEPEVASLSDLCGRSAEDLVQRLTEAPTPPAKFAVMEAWLWQHVREPHRAYRQVERAVVLLSDPASLRSVDSVAREVGLSPRRLLNLFREDVGLAPKTFARVMRFGASIRLVRDAGHARWTDIAAMCNFYDQAHLVREFHSLAGMSPTSYMQQKTAGHANCLPWIPPGSARAESNVHHAGGKPNGLHLSVPR